MAPRIAAFAEHDVFDALSRLYFDTALSAHPNTLTALRRIAPLEQILFGSDWPFTPEFGVARGSSC